jgi:hypothetical protein
MGRTMAIGKPACASFKNQLTSGKLLKLVGLNQKKQTKLQLLKQAGGSPMIKPSMHYVKNFHHLNSQEFQIVKLLKMHGKF